MSSCEAGELRCEYEGSKPTPHFDLNCTKAAATDSALKRSSMNPSWTREKEISFSDAKQLSSRSAAVGVALCGFLSVTSHWKLLSNSTLTEEQCQIAQSLLSKCPIPFAGTHPVPMPRL